MFGYSNDGVNGCKNESISKVKKDDNHILMEDETLESALLQKPLCQSNSMNSPSKLHQDRSGEELRRENGKQGGAENDQLANISNLSTC